MAWPITTATKTHLDASTDDPSQARAELASLVDKVNEIINQMATIAAVNKIAVWDATGKMNGDITGNAVGAKDALGTGSIPFCRAENTLRIIRGNIGNDGSAADGAGFSSSKISTGVYDITWTNAFSDIPMVTANVSGFTTFYKGFVVIGSPSATTCRVYVWDHTGTAMDGPIHFIAIGPN